MIFESKDFSWCINWYANQGYTIEVIPESKYTGDLKMVATEYVDAAKEIPFRSIILKFKDWKCVEYKWG